MTETQTPTLTGFLLARIAEDEERARAAIEDDGGHAVGFGDSYYDLIRPPSGVGSAEGGFGEAAARMIATYAVPARVLAECEAKRRIVEWDGVQPVDRGVLNILVAVYADHPDYREEWRA